MTRYCPRRNPTHATGTVMLNYILIARQKFGARTDIRGNGPFALVSKCGVPLVYLYPTAERRAECAARWNSSHASCGRTPCFGASGHQFHNLWDLEA
jgi:hypothetical protein